MTPETTETWVDQLLDGWLETQREPLPYLALMGLRRKLIDELATYRVEEEP